MKLDQKAKDFISKAKASGKSKEDTMAFLQSKGYELGQEAPKQALTPLTEEQKLQVKTEVDRLAPEQPFAQTVLEEVPFIAKNLQRNLNPARIIPGGEGLMEKGEALVGAIGSKATYGDELERIRAEKALYRQQTGIPGAIAQAGYDIAGGGKLGQALGLDAKIGALGKGGQRLLQAGLGAVEGATLAEDPATGGLIGGAVGLVAPELIGGAIKGTSKVAGKVAPAVEEVISKVLKKTGGKDIADIASDDKTMSKVLKGINSSKQTASIYRDVSDKALEDTYDRTQRKVSKALGIDDITELGIKAKKQYNDTFAKYRNKTIGGDKITAYHGSMKDFDLKDFDLDKASDGSFLGKGMHGFTSEVKAREYGDFVKKFKLNKTDVFDMDATMSPEFWSKNGVTGVNKPSSIGDLISEFRFNRSKKDNYKSLTNFMSNWDKNFKAVKQGDMVNVFSPSELGKPSLYDNETLSQALKAARKQDLTGELSELGDNTLGVAQSVKEALDDRIANSYVSKGLAKPQATKETRQLMQIRKGFVDKLDNVFPDYKKVRTDYGKFRQSQNLIDDILKPRGKEDSNLASLLLTNKNKQYIKEALGEEQLQAFTKTLREEDNIYKNLKSISTKARNRVQDRNAITKRLEKSILSRDVVAPIAVGAVTSPTVGAAVLGGELAAGIGSDIYKSNVARGLIQGTESLDPFVQAILAQQAGGIGR